MLLNYVNTLDSSSNRSQRCRYGKENTNYSGTIYRGSRNVVEVRRLPGSYQL